MLQFELFGIKVRLSFLFFAVVTIYLLLDESGYGYCGVLAVFSHELGHVIAYFLVGERPKALSFSVEGMRITASERYLTPGKDIFALSAGCLVNFILFAVGIYGNKTGDFTQLAFTQLFIGIFNALPIGALDGGMILKRLLLAFLPIKAACLISKIVSWAVLLPLFGCSVYLLVSAHNITLFVTSLFLLVNLITDQQV